MKIKSSTIEGLEYEVDLEKGTCECSGFRSTGHCKHLKLARATEMGQFKEKIEFLGNTPMIRHFRSGGLRVEIEVPESEWDKIKDLFFWRDVNIKVTVEKEDE